MLGFMKKYHGDWLAVGSVYDNENGLKSGSAYVFYYDGESWMEYTKIVPIDGAPSDRFGFSIDIYDDVLVCGAIYDDDGGENSGSAYIYKLVNAKGPKHNPIFKVSVSINNSKTFFGLGNSKKNAEQNAALNLLKFIDTD